MYVFKEVRITNDHSQQRKQTQVTKQESKQRTSHKRRNNRNGQAECDSSKGIFRAKQKEVNSMKSVMLRKEMVSREETQ